MDIQQWDKEVAPYLQIVESRARALSRETRQLVPFIRHLASKPAIPFETKAEEELENAERAATDLLAAIRAMRLQYKGAAFLAEPNPAWAGYEAELQAAE
jgi:hypothetical protein